MYTKRLAPSMKENTANLDLSFEVVNRRLFSQFTSVQTKKPKSRQSKCKLSQSPIKESHRLV